MPAGTCRVTDSEGRASWLAAFNFPHWHRDSRAAPPTRELAGSIVPSSHAPNAQLTSGHPNLEPQAACQCETVTACLPDEMKCALGSPAHSHSLICMPTYSTNQRRIII